MVGVESEMSENVGTAAFVNDKMCGELNSIETISLLTTRNNIDRFLISIPDPYDDEKYIDIYISPEKSPDIKVNTSNYSPYIKAKFTFTGRIYSMTSDSKYLSTEVLDNISEYCNKYLENIFSEFFYKTSKELKSDICGIGKYALSNFATTQEFNDYNWEKNYQNAFFKVEVNTSVKSGMLITET